MRNLHTLVIVLCWLACVQTEAANRDSIRVMAINAQWLWTPFDKRAEGQHVKRTDPKPADYIKELEFYAGLIKSHDIDLVALSEVENELVADDLARRLGGQWRHYFKQGRDSATGQDVAIISRLTYIENSVTDFGFPCGHAKGLKKKKCLTKVLGVAFWVGNKKEKQAISFITSHFLSKRNENKTKRLKRYAQADALNQAIGSFLTKYGEKQVVLGDFNDELNSNTLRILQRDHGLRSWLACTGAEQDRRIDHILFKGMRCAAQARISLESFSDHHAVLAVLEFWD